MKNTERVSFYSHLTGFAAAVSGTFLLLYVSDGLLSRILISIIYGLSTSFLFLASSLYHYSKKEEDGVSIWRKLDHFAIFVMIAGTYTPVSYIYLTGYWKWGIIILQWSLVFAGFFFKFFYLKAPRILYTVIYLLMGWVGIIPIKGFIEAMPIKAVIYLFMGGVSFTIGAVFYILKKPLIKPGFGFHEIFHLFILLGGFFHFLLVYTAVAG